MLVTVYVDRSVTSRIAIDFRAPATVTRTASADDVLANGTSAEAVIVETRPSVEPGRLEIYALIYDSKDRRNRSRGYDARESRSLSLLGTGLGLAVAACHRTRPVRRIRLRGE